MRQLQEQMPNSRAFSPSISHTSPQDSSLCPDRSAEPGLSPQAVTPGSDALLPAFLLPSLTHGHLEHLQLLHCFGPPPSSVPSLPAAQEKQSRGRVGTCWWAGGCLHHLLARKARLACRPSPPASGPAAPAAGRQWEADSDSGSRRCLGLTQALEQGGGGI